MAQTPMADLGDSEIDPSEFLVSTQSATECERLQAKRKDGMKKLKTWLGYR
jgi:hypothetical protein